MKLTSGVAEDRLRDFESRFSVCLPLDFRLYFFDTNGTGSRDEYESGFFCFWPIEEVVPLQRRIPRPIYRRPIRLFPLRRSLNLSTCVRDSTDFIRNRAEPGNRHSIGPERVLDHDRRPLVQRIHQGAIWLAKPRESTSVSDRPYRCNARSIVGADGKREDFRICTSDSESNVDLSM